MDIRHKSGKGNTNADTLSRNHVPEAHVLQVETKTDSSCTHPLPAEEYTRLEGIATMQKNDADFQLMMSYLDSQELPDDEKRSKWIVLNSAHFELIDGVLHRENPHSPGRWCLVVPVEYRSTLLKEVHNGRYSGHLAEKRVYDTLRRSYWWPGIRADVR